MVLDCLLCVAVGIGCRWFGVDLDVYVVLFVVCGDWFC